ncbi:ATP-binding cassette sub-family C member 3-like, partial [Saccoglossus kowalevskii]
SIIAKEERPKGAVGCAIFLAYVRAMTVPLAVILFIAYLLEIACFAAVNLWISAWSQAGQDSLNKSEIEQELTVRYYLPRYAIFTSLVIPVAILFNVCFIAFFIMTAKKLFRKILYKVMHSPIRFFETTPVGRILNRFSVDMLSVDVHFWMTLSLVLIILISLFGTIVVNTIISPYFLLVMVPISVIIGVSLDFGVRLPRDLKRLDRVTLSPVLAYFTDTYNTIGMCLVLFVGVGALIASMYRTINPSDVGLAVTTGILAAQFVNGLMTVIVDLFCYVSGVERVIEYTKLDTEELQGSIDVPDSWPDKGSIDLYNVTVRYADELEPALTNINIHVNAGEKVNGRFIYMFDRYLICSTAACILTLTYVTSLNLSTISFVK